MNKSAKFVSFAAVALNVLAFLVFIVIILFQRQLKPIFAAPADVVAIFNFPIAQTLFMLSAGLAILLPCAGVFLKGKGIWPELLCIVMLLVFCPVLGNLGSTLETSLIAAPRGSTYLASFSVMQSLTAIPVGMTNTASSLALIACGMNIVFKKHVLPNN